MDTSNLYTLRNALLKNHLGLENSVQSCVELDKVKGWEEGEGSTLVIPKLLEAES